MHSNIQHSIEGLVFEINELLEVGHHAKIPAEQQALITSYSIRKTLDSKAQPTPEEQDAINKHPPHRQTAQAWALNIERVFKDKKFNAAQTKILYNSASTTLKRLFNNHSKDPTHALKHAFIDPISKLTFGLNTLKITAQEGIHTDEVSAAEILTSLEKTLLDISHNYGILIESGYIPDCVLDIYTEETIPQIKEILELLPSPASPKGTAEEMDNGIEHITHRLPENFWEIN